MAKRKQVLTVSRWIMRNDIDAGAFLLNYFQAVDALIKRPYELSAQQRVQAVHFVFKDTLRSSGVKLP